MFKRVTITLALLASFPLTLSSVSADVDWNIDMLGFSADSKYFVLAESVTGDGAGIASAKIIIADVATNKCVRGGCQSASGSENNLRTEQAVLKEVYKKTWRLRKRLKLTPPQTGYLANGPYFPFDETGKNARYSINDRRIYVSMQQKAVPGPDEFQKKAAVQITVRAFGEMGNDVTKVLDSLNNYRESAQKYQLGRLYISPDNKRIALLVHVYYRGFEGYDIRTIVQTANLF
jgi:predicted secreted protein